MTSPSSFFSLISSIISCCEASEQANRCVRVTSTSRFAFERHPRLPSRSRGQRCCRHSGRCSTPIRRLSVPSPRPSSVRDKRLLGPPPRRSAARCPECPSRQWWCRPRYSPSIFVTCRFTNGIDFAHISEIVRSQLSSLVERKYIGIGQKSHGQNHEVVFARSSCRLRPACLRIAMPGCRWEVAQFEQPCP